MVPSLCVITVVIVHPVLWGAFQSAHMTPRLSGGGQTEILVLVNEHRSQMAQIIMVVNEGGGTLSNPIEDMRLAWMLRLVHTPGTGQIRSRCERTRVLGFHLLRNLRPPHAHQNFRSSWKISTYIGLGTANLPMLLVAASRAMPPPFPISHPHLTFSNEFFTIAPLICLR